MKSLSEKPRLEALEKALQPRRVQDVRFDPGSELVGLTGEAAGSIQMDSTATPEAREVQQKHHRVP